ncbi:hypothetical protein M3I53_19690 [Paraburkholderia sp. CNPSo 3272]|nr:hypothetical protein [Paraburkholderia sp. CNPSo 3272]
MIRAVDAEQALVGKPFDARAIHEAARLAMAACNPVDRHCRRARLREPRVRDERRDRGVEGRTAHVDPCYPG